MQVVRVVRVDKDVSFSEGEDGVFVVEVEVADFATQRINVEFEPNGVDFTWAHDWGARFVSYRFAEGEYQKIEDILRAYMTEHNVLAMYPYESGDYWEVIQIEFTLTTEKWKRFIKYNR
jgi:hypothetical protein